MPYSLLNYISPVIIHTFLIRLFQSSAVVLFIILAWAALKSRPEKPSAAHEKGSAPYPQGYKILWWGLGLLWVFDGLLQAQPPMATSMFVDMDVASNLANQPHWLVGLLGAGIQLWTNHQISSSVFAVLIQILIGAGILAGRGKRLGRSALYVSIGWSVIVWIYGEGLGGIFGSGPTWLSGTPGAVLFYILGAVWLLLPDRYWVSGQVSRWTRYVMGGLWLLLALFQAWPAYGFWSSQGLYNLFRFNSLTPQPVWLLDPIVLVMHSTQSHAAVWNGLFVAVMATMGLMLLLNRAGKAFWVIGSAWLIFSWWFGQDFGIVGGVGTDPQAAPLAALILIGGWWYAAPSRISERAEEGHTVLRASRRYNMRQAAWAGSTLVMMACVMLGFVTPQIVEAQGDSVSSSQKPVRPVSTVPRVFRPQEWMQVNPSTKTVTLRAEATVNRFGSLSFNGYANGFMTIQLPENWTVHVAFINRQALVNNSAMIVPYPQLVKGGPFSPAFPGASTPHPSQGVSQGVLQHFSFVAAKPGKYALISAVPDGQADSGMWDYVIVSSSLKAPRITAR